MFPFGNDLIFQIANTNSKDLFTDYTYIDCVTYTVRLSKTLTKVLAFKRIWPPRIKLIIDNHPIQQVLYFNYLRCNIN